jgi:hypothetical protein
MNLKSLSAERRSFLKAFWAQIAAGALVASVVAALALLPARLLGPAGPARTLTLPATVAAPAVHIALPPAPPKHHSRPARAAKRVVAAPDRLASVQAPPPPAPVAAAAPKPAAKPAPKRTAAAHAPLVSAKRLSRPRLPKQPLAPRPAPAPAPAAAQSVTTTTPLQPQPIAAAPAAPATSTTTTTVQQPPGDGHDGHHGHGHGHNR